MYLRSLSSKHFREQSFSRNGAVQRLFDLDGALWRDSSGSILERTQSRLRDAQPFSKGFGRLVKHQSIFAEDCVGFFHAYIWYQQQFEHVNTHRID